MDAFADKTGGGNQTSPYIIRDFVINGSGTGSCIELIGVTRYVTFINCTMLNSGSSPPGGDAGVELFFCQNIVVTNCTMYDNLVGIRIYGNSDFITVDHCESHTNDIEGILLSSSNNITLDYNIVLNNGETGIYLDMSCDNKVTNNNASLNGIQGIYLSHYSDDNAIFLNVFASNTNFEARDDGARNSWTNGIIGNNYGNYTTRYPSAHNDGILWDTPYEIYGNTHARDNYPVFDVSGTHNPITITSNAELDAFCNLNGTDGLSWATAHVIANYRISARGGPYCIFIDNVDRYLIIRNCTVLAAYEDPWNSCGFRIRRCINLRITNCTAKYNTNGIATSGLSHDLIIDGNNVTLNTCYGIDIYNTPNSTIFNNTISNNSLNGLYISTGSYNENVSSNMVEDNGINGIIVEYSNNVTVEKNYILHNMYGMQLNTCNETKAVENTFMNSTYFGIDIFSGTWNATLDSNDVINSAVMGIHIRESFRTTMISNDLTNNSIMVEGSMSQLTSYIIDTTNLVNNKPIYYYYDKTGLISSNFTNAGEIILLNCNSSSIDDINCSTASNGIVMMYCHDNAVRNATLSSFTSSALYIQYSTNCTVNNSVFRDCFQGITLVSSERGHLRNNNFTNCGLRLQGNNRQCASHDIDGSNRVNGRVLRYIVNQTNLVAADFANSGQVILINTNGSSVSNQNLSHASLGLCTMNSRDNVFTNIDLHESAEAGTWMISSDNNSLIQCNISLCSWGLYMIYSYNDAVLNSTIDGNYEGGYLIQSHCINMTGTTLSNNMDMGILLSQSNMTMDNCKVHHNYVGIDLDMSQLSTIRNSNVSDNEYAGVAFNQGHNNTLYQNRIINNGYGVLLGYSSNNSIYHNTIANNTLSEAYYDSFYAETHNFWYNESEGNYWGDYTAKYPSATPSGRVWLTPYVLNGSTTDVDPFPLRQPWEPDVTPTANFTANMTNILALRSIQFTFSGSNGNQPASYQWSFGDGSPNATVQNPVHVYMNSGIFNVILTVIDADGDTATIHKNNFINVHNNIPVANFTATFTGSRRFVATGRDVQFTFTGIGTDAPLRYQWSFGDGTSNSTSRDPIHVFQVAGNFTIVLTVIDANDDAVTKRYTGFIRAFAYGDDDVDGLTNWDEIYVFNTNPDTNDTDNDEMLDSYEIHNGLNPNLNDSADHADDDGLTNLEESILGTSANNSDTDGDSFPDNIELEWHTDPRLAFSSPLTIVILPIAVASAILIGVTGRTVLKKKKQKYLYKKDTSSYKKDELEEQLTEGSQALYGQISEKRAILSRVLEPTTQDEHAGKLAGSAIAETSAAAKKKKAGSTGEEVVQHAVDAKTEAEIDVIKKKESCIVCNTPLKGTNFICPYCETKYCIRCAIALSQRQEACWACKNPLNFNPDDSP